MFDQQGSINVLSSTEEAYKNSDINIIFYCNRCCNSCMKRHDRSVRRQTTLHRNYRQTSTTNCCNFNSLFLNYESRTAMSCLIGNTDQTPLTFDNPYDRTLDIKRPSVSTATMGHEKSGFTVMLCCMTNCYLKRLLVAGRLTKFIGHLMLVVRSLSQRSVCLELGASSTRIYRTRGITSCKSTPEQCASTVEVEVMAEGTVRHRCIVNGVVVRCTIGWGKKFKIFELSFRTNLN